MKFFRTPNSKNIIATLRIVTIAKSELAFLLIFYLDGIMLPSIFENTQNMFESYEITSNS